LIEKYHIDKDSLRHGITEKYYASGAIFEKANYHHGKLEGERLLYYENGVVEIREKYCNDMLCDTLTTYYDGGERRFQGVYNHNVLSGIVKVYYNTGELKEEVTFIDNIENGAFKEYHKNGMLMWEGEYRNGPNEYGTLIEYDDKGIKIKEMLCDTLAVCRTVWQRE